VRTIESESDKKDSPKAAANEVTPVEKLPTQEELLKKIENQNKELLAEYAKEGSFVYELYAVMVHSGGAQGGHYYAYIKDLETDKWYNFNDSIVREISVIDVVEMFGPEPTLPAKPGVKRNMAAKRMAASRTANAYMLMYRIVDSTEDRSTAFNVHEDEIPNEIREDLEKDEQKT